MVGRNKGSVKIREMEDNGYKDIVLALRTEGRSHGYIARLVTEDEGIVPEFNIGSGTIGRALKIWGDPNYRPPKSVTIGSRKKGSIYDFEGDIKKLVVDGYNAKQIGEHLLLVRGYRLRPGELKEVIDKWEIKITGGKSYVGTSPIDFDIVNGNYR